ncbi:hypothetical protein [Sorangium sp. So ce117]
MTTVLQLLSILMAEPPPDAARLIARMKVRGDLQDELYGSV